MPTFLTRKAEVEAEEVRRWSCVSCDTLVEDEGAEHCRACRSYWSDVAQGLYDASECEW